MHGQRPDRADARMRDSCSNILAGACLLPVSLRPGAQESDSKRPIAPAFCGVTGGVGRIRVRDMEISVAGSTFIGQLLTFGILIVAIETRVVQRPFDRWMLVGFLLAVIATAISIVALLYIFNSINYDEPIVGGRAWAIVAICWALYIAVFISMLSSLIVRYSDADRLAQSKEKQPDPAVEPATSRRRSWRRRDI
jgi:uncharacterized membrane protein